MIIFARPTKHVVRSVLGSAAIFAAVMLFLFLISVAVPATARAQEAGNDIENLFSKEDQEPAAPVDMSPELHMAAPAPTPAPQKVNDVKGVSDLGKLSPFSDVAVIQKRYLPRTGRFELHLSPTFVMNDAFFLNFGLDGRLAYYFRERYGIEFTGFFLTTSERQVTSDLRDKRGVSTRTIVSPKSYLGLDFKWTPIYGKMTWINRSIVPFDLYFSLGGGTTATNQGANEPTIHLGTGQAFALSKSMAARWDFSWNLFQSTNVSGGRSLFNNLYLSVGMSWFFPEATYR